MKTQLKESIRNEREINKYFDNSSKSSGSHPTCTIIMGGVAVGKTRLRREEYSRGHVLIDAAEIFLSFCNNEHVDFPSPKLDKRLNQIGSTIALRAFEERRNIVTEIIGADYEELKSVIHKIESVGYRVVVIPIISDVIGAWKRNLERGRNNISAYYCEPYNLKWILSALIFA